MPLTVNSSEVQQNFGRIIDQSLTEGDIIVERYGQPHIVILNYQRYQQLLAHQQAYLSQPSLAEAAEMLLADYTTDTELTAFTVLDGEEFHAAG